MPIQGPEGDALAAADLVLRRAEIEAEFEGAVGDVGGVGLFAIVVAHLLLQAANETSAVDARSKIGIALCEVIVDGGDVDAFADER